MKLRKKICPITINTKEMHTNHGPKVLWYCSHNRQVCGVGAGSSLMVSEQGHRRLLRPAMLLVRLMHQSSKTKVT